MIFMEPKTDKPYLFSIFRIMGGDNPPRDKLGSRLEVMKFILENEPPFSRTHKGWLLNAVHDMDLRAKMCELLRKHNAFYVVCPMARLKYLEAKTRDDKIRQAIPINHARNLAFLYGRNLATFTTILDGDCFFNTKAWNEVSLEVRRDQQSGSNLKHYSIPHIRSEISEMLKNDKPIGDLAEPMIMMRHDSNQRFKENIVFGQGDKLEFLYRLGHSTEPNKHHLLAQQGKTKTVGHVYHLATGEEEAESNTRHRIALRNESVDRLLEKIDNTPPKQRMPNDYWKKIQNWFDFQGIYSHFVFDAPEEATFVEVGSWLGASACYLATEIKNRGKKIKLYAVDTWEGSDEAQHKQLIQNMTSLGKNLFDTFTENMKLGGVSDIVIPVRMSSLEASKTFADESLDLVFIDASHTYKDVMDDLNSWFPKVKRGGKIAGHDYIPGHPTSEAGVMKAVNKFFHHKQLELSPAGRTWLHHKI